MLIILWKWNVATTLVCRRISFHTIQNNRQKEKCVKPKEKKEEEEKEDDGNEKKEEEEEEEEVTWSHENCNVFSACQPSPYFFNSCT